MDEVLEVLLKVVALGLLEDVDEDSTALASAIETFAFALAKFVLQTLIWFLLCVQCSYSWSQHHSIMPTHHSAEEPVPGSAARTTYRRLHSNMISDRVLELPKSPRCNCLQNPSSNYNSSMMSALFC